MHPVFQHLPKGTEAIYNKAVKRIGLTRAIVRLNSLLQANENYNNSIRELDNIKQAKEDYVNVSHLRNEPGMEAIFYHISPTKNAKRDTELLASLDIEKHNNVKKARNELAAAYDALRYAAGE